MISSRCDSSIIGFDSFVGKAAKDEITRTPLGWMATEESFTRHRSQSVDCSSIAIIMLLIELRQDSTCKDTGHGVYSKRGFNSKCQPEFPPACPSLVK